MRSRMFFFVALMACVSAQAGQGMYEKLNYRNDDPFVFCTQGQDTWDTCWKPIPPYTGAWIYTGICDEPNPKGRSWYQRDRDSLSQYMRVCPNAIDSGSWDGRGGAPENTPGPH
jgi:hypothetical protein